MHICAPECIRTPECLTGDARISPLCKHFASRATSQNLVISHLERIEAMSNPTKSLTCRV